jgi:hypothetical protein
VSISFVFDSALGSILDGDINLGSDVLYFHLVTTIPDANTDSTVADLVLPTDPEYAVTYLQGRSWSNQVLNSTPPIFPRLTTNPLTVKGSVLCRRNGEDPSDEDSLLCFNIFRNNGGLNVMPNLELERIRASYNQGILTIQDLYAYVSAPDPLTYPEESGLLYLIGTDNYTQPYQTPSTASPAAGRATKVSVVHNAVTNAGSIFKRDTSAVSAVVMAASANFPRLAINFQSPQGRLRTVRIGRFTIIAGTVYSGVLFKIYGTNFLPAFDGANIVVSDNWTLLNQSVLTPHAVPTHCLVNSSSYYRYIGFGVDNPEVQIRYIEMFDSSIISPTQNVIEPY